MLTYFSVENFKNFKNKIEWKLDKANNYEFNEDAVKNQTIMKGIIFGYNGSGKSNFGLAVFDIISHLTDCTRLIDAYSLYKNLDGIKKYASFEYKFNFDNHIVDYKYKKSSLDSLLEEELVIDGKLVLFYDYENSKGEITLEGAEHFSIDMLNNKLSRVKAIKSNVLLTNNEVNTTFMRFMTFVEKMLMFYTLDNRGYQGFKVGRDTLSNTIVRSGRLKEFQKVLEDNNIFYTLTAKAVDDEMEIFCRFKNKYVNLFEIASTGTRALALFFYWYIQMENTSFVFIDEFDAFYHFELSEYIVRKLCELKNCQIFLTTHNTDLLSNDLLRPDCFFEIEHSSIKTFADRTKKELRKAHNLQKMYKAGAFNE